MKETPRAPSKRGWISGLVAVSAVSSLPLAARAQVDPKFQFAKGDPAAAAAAEVPAAPPPAEWKAQVKGGVTLTGGNSQTQAGTLAATASRKQGNNKLALDAAASYGRSNNRIAVIDPATNTITGLDRRSVVSTNNWTIKGRYDRFFTLNNSGYASAQGAADTIAGKTFFGGGQIGYSRQLLKTGLHLVVAEIGYDFSYERYVEQPGKVLDPVAIHSARVFAGETLTLSPVTGITASVEALFNLNKEGKAIDVSTGQPGVGAFADTRVVGKVGLTTTLRKRLSIGFGFTLKYDQNPAVLPVPSGSPSGAAFAAGFQPFAEKVDVLAEATLIYTFL